MTTTLSRSSVFLFFVTLAALFSLFYLSSMVGDNLPLIAHSKPRLTKEQALDIAKNYLRNQIANVTNIRTEQQVREAGPDPSSAKIPMFLGFYDAKNKMSYSMNSTDYTLIGPCNLCVTGSDGFKNTLNGHIFYIAELYVTKGLGNYFYPVFVDAMTGEILYPKDVFAGHPLLKKS